LELGSFKFSVVSFKFKRRRKKKSGGAGPQNVGAPTMAIDVVVTTGDTKARLQLTADS
jgi:hypothetical protein